MAGVVGSSSRSDAYLRAAEIALGVFRGRPATRLRPGTRLKKLTFFLSESALHRAKPYWIVNDDYTKAADLDDRVGDLALAHPAAAQVEELRLNWKSYGDRYLYCPRLEYLPCAATLRLLELTSCNLEPPTPSKGRLTSMDLPRLTDLRLEGCVVSEGFLQVMVDAAPKLNKLVLVNVHHKVGEKTDTAWGTSIVPDCRLRLQLRCPTVTALVLDTNECREEFRACAADESGIQLDMPSLRSFSYRGYPVKLSLTSPAHELAVGDLCLTHSSQGNSGIEPASRMLRSFSSTRALKLRLSCIEDMLVGEGEEEGGAILPRFPNLELLELHGQYDDTNHGTATALAVAGLLGSCPGMSELRLLLKIKRDGHDRYQKLSKDPPGGAFGVSMDRFNRLASLAYMQGRDDGVEYHEISDLAAAALSGGCMLGCLRKVTLKFESRELNCLPVQLAKFLVENSMVLQEMRVDDGNQFWSDHLCNNVARWRANSLRRRNLPDTRDFQVYYS